MPTVCVANQKGGVAKTLTAINLASGLARRGRPVLIVDLDTQSSVAPGLGVEPPAGLLPMIDALARQGRGGERILATPFDNLFVMPGDPTVDNEALTKVVMRESVLQRALKPLCGRFAWIVLDTSPTLDLVTCNAILAADRLVLPVDSDKEALQGLKRTVEVAFAYLEHRPEVDPATFCRALRVMHDDRDKIMNAWLTGELARLEIPMFETVIHRAAAVRKSRAFGLPVFDFADRFRGDGGGKRAVVEFDQFVSEVVAHG